METYDAIIIGAGPAGLMAARELEKYHVNYMIIETKSKIGSHLKCGEITREDTFIEIFNRTDYPFIKNKISNISFQIKNTRKLFKKNMFMLDKSEFLQWLAEPIEDNLMLNTKVVQIEKKENFLEIVTSNGTFYTKLAVLANGTNYKFQKDHNLVKKNVELVPCIGGFFINTTLHQDTAYFCYDEEMYIALWIFPKENNLFNAGAGIILKNKRTEGLNLVKAFKQSLKKFEIPLEGEPGFGGHYVANGPIGRTYSDRLLVCGDSAGQVFAGIGEGIYFALKAGQLTGKMAIKAIKENSFHREYLKNYEVDWKKSFGQQMDAGVIFTTVLFFLMRYHLAYNTLKIVKPKELLGIWFNGNVSFRLKVLYFFLKSIGYSPKR
jgi:digeranylgeranylglycerophospholipid reductase